MTNLTSATGMRTQQIITFLRNICRSITGTLFIGLLLGMSTAGCRHQLEVQPPGVASRQVTPIVSGIPISIVVQDEREAKDSIGNHLGSDTKLKLYTARNLRDSLGQRVAVRASQYGFAPRSSTDLRLVATVSRFQVLTSDASVFDSTRRDGIDIAGTLRLIGASGEQIYSNSFDKRSNRSVSDPSFAFALFDDAVAEWFEHLSQHAQTHAEFGAAIERAQNSNVLSSASAYVAGALAKNPPAVSATQPDPGEQQATIDVDIDNLSECEGNAGESKWIKPHVRPPEKRVAMVIGNSAYSFAPLPNPVKDAKLICRTLLALGFQVKRLYDADQATMKRSIEAFGSKLSEATVGLFYYAGHGAQMDGRNFIIPVGARINSEREIDIEGVDIDRVLAQMDRNKAGINVVVLDACRNNPFPRASRAATRGLALISQAPNGTLIAYSTSPGAIAEDGGGANSPYTEALAKQMIVKGAQLEETFKAVRRHVETRTQGRQMPWELSSLTGNFQFAPPELQPVKAVPAPQVAAPAALNSWPSHRLQGSNSQPPATRVKAAPPPSTPRKPDQPPASNNAPQSSNDEIE